MESLLTSVLNIGLFLAVLLSAQLAVAWGELGSYPIQGDKSGMAGFGAIVFIMPIRWVLVTAVLVASVRRGLFASLPGGQWVKISILIGVHLVLGIVAYQVFEWITRELRLSNPGPQRLAILFGLLLPTPILLLAFFGVNRSWISRHWLIASIVAALVVWSQIATWRQGYVRRIPAPILTPGDGEPMK